ncbi:MAG: L,D-transpeptidase family protein [Gemmatimonadaceae bacterium]|nr:L,D-transpeptidase family protein [Gemmatimonadaceae bacterium]
MSPHPTRNVATTDAHGGAAGQIGADAVARAIRQLVAHGPVPGFSGADWAIVRRVYAASGHAPVWIDTAGGTLQLRNRAMQFIDALSRAADQALSLDVYPVGTLIRAVDAMRTAGSTSPARAARADVLLSATLVAYATHVLTGQVDPRSINREWYIEPRTQDVDSTIADLFREPERDVGIADLEPRDPEYALLVAQVARYRGLVARGGWPRVEQRGILRPGELSTARVLGTLLARLHLEGYLPLVALTPRSVSAGDSTAFNEARGPDRSVQYDRALSLAVADYQERQGLTVDSVLGPVTRASLNRPATFRLHQLEANLERHRWLPRDRGQRFVVVNVPAFRLRAYDHGQAVLSMKVVVGAEYQGRATPAFSDSMSYVVFRPYWNVPRSIARRELWPRQRQDPTYFRRHGYEVVRTAAGANVRQKPAADNALGRAKFIFPNSFAIYLHDTPAQALFDERVRARSHGCIRVEHPDELAEFVLGAQGWDLDRVRAAMESGADDERVNLERRLPVYIVYFTAFFRDGVLHFANDIYDRDGALVSALGVAARGPNGEGDEASRLRTLARTLAARD